jgi:hypothetical protein
MASCSSKPDVVACLSLAVCVAVRSLLAFGAFRCCRLVYKKPSNPRAETDTLSCSQESTYSTARSAHQRCCASTCLPNVEASITARSSTNSFYIAATERDNNLLWLSEPVTIFDSSRLELHQAVGNQGIPYIKHIAYTSYSCHNPLYHFCWPLPVT